MAVAVVDGPEVIDVHHLPVGGPGIARVEVQLQRLCQPPAVERVRHGVARRHVAQVIGQAAQHQPDDGGREHGRQGGQVEQGHASRWSRRLPRLLPQHGSAARTTTRHADRGCLHRAAPAAAKTSVPGPMPCGWRNSIAYRSAGQG